MAAQLKFDLLNNSISYFREAVSYAQRDEPDASHWKFAITHVTQAMELAFKERLRRVNAAFIYADVDAHDKTISLSQAISRLKNRNIGNFAISDADNSKILRSFKLRNQITHFEFDYTQQYMEAVFSEIFSFMMFFYTDELELEAADFITEEQHAKIISMVKTRSELLKRAKSYIEAKSDIDVWACISCGEDTFTVADQICIFCRHAESVVECPSCGELVYESEIVETSDLFDYSIDEGRMKLENDFGFEHKACEECASDMRQKIDEVRKSQYLEDLAMDEAAFHR